MTTGGNAPTGCSRSKARSTRATRRAWRRKRRMRLRRPRAGRRSCVGTPAASLSPPKRAPRWCRRLSRPRRPRPLPAALLRARLSVVQARRLRRLPAIPPYILNGTPRAPPCTPRPAHRHPVLRPRRGLAIVLLRGARQQMRHRSHRSLSVRFVLRCTTT